MSIFNITNQKFNPLSKEFWIKILIMTIAILIVSFTSLAKVDNPLWAILAAIIISLLNAFIRPLLSFVAMPLIMYSFGLFFLVINAIIILICSMLLGPHFEINGFWDAFFFSIIVTVISFLLNIPRKVHKVSKGIYSNMSSHDSNIFNKDNQTDNDNQQGSNRFDDNPFNDNPQEKNYTDYEESDQENKNK